MILEILDFLVPHLDSAIAAEACEYIAQMETLLKNLALATIFYFLPGEDEFRLSLTHLEINSKRQDVRNCNFHAIMRTINVRSCAQRPRAKLLLAFIFLQLCVFLGGNWRNRDPPFFNGIVFRFYASNSVGSWCD